MGLLSSIASNFIPGGGVAKTALDLYGAVKKRKQAAAIPAAPTIPQGGGPLPAVLPKPNITSAPAPAAPKATPVAPRAVTPPTATPAIPIAPPATPAAESSGLADAVAKRAGDTSRDKLYESLTTATTKAGDFDPVSRYKSLQEERGIPQQREIAAKTRENISETNALLESLKGDLKARTGEFLVPEAAFNRILASEREPLTDQLSTLERLLSTTQSNIEGETSDIANLLGLEESAATRPLENIKSQIDALSALDELDRPDTVNIDGQIVERDPSTGEYRAVFGEKKADTEVVNAGGRQLLIDSATGSTIRDIGPSPSGMSGGSGVGSGGLVDSIVANPGLFNNLTPSIQASIIPALSAAGFKFPRKLTGAQATAQQNGQSALQALQTVEANAFDADGSVNTSALMFAETGLGGLAAARREIIDVISRIRTGAALTASEEAFYKKQAPRAVDDTATARQKMNQLAAFYAGIAGSEITLQGPNGEALTYDDLYNVEQRKEVRDAISEGWNIIDY